MVKIMTINTWGTEKTCKTSKDGGEGNKSD